MSGTLSLTITRRDATQEERGESEPQEEEEEEVGESEPQEEEEEEVGEGGERGGRGVALPPLSAPSPHAFPLSDLPQPPPPPPPSLSSNGGAPALIASETASTEAPPPTRQLSEDPQIKLGSCPV